MKNEAQSRAARLTPWILAAIAATTLAFAARAQQKAGAPEKALADDGAGMDAPIVPALTEEALEAAVEEAEAEQAGETRQADGGSTVSEAETVQEVPEVPAAAANAVAQKTAPLPGLSLWRKAKLSGRDESAAWTATTAEGKQARLTIDPRLQSQMVKLFATYKPMTAAVVAIDPKTGRVLALAEYAQDGKPEGLATRPLYPAASVFKLITGAALLDKGISPEAETCYHGGMHGIVGKLLQDKPRLDRRCLSLSMALAKSANVVFAKMAVKHLDADSLRKEAEKFLFNRPVWEDPHGPSVERSTAEIPASGLEFAKSAAGFGQVRLSPLHAALIAAAVANGGIAQSPTLLDEVDGVAPAPTESLRLMRETTAASLREMMKLTVSQGTATNSFRERRRFILGDIEVAGKTGSLSNHQKPFKDYSWFVGFAPADHPKIAVAAVVVNGLKWRIHAPFVAREALRAYLVGGSIGQPPVARVVHRRRKHR